MSSSSPSSPPSSFAPVPPPAPDSAGAAATTGLGPPSSNLSISSRSSGLSLPSSSLTVQTDRWLTAISASRSCVKSSTVRHPPCPTPPPGRSTSRLGRFAAHSSGPTSSPSS